jgi:quercetin dioxygenase-like cupin family protein
LLLHIALLAVTALLAVATPEATHQEVVKPIRAEKLANAPGKTLTVVTVNYPPGGKSGVHHHAGSVLAYVLSGAIRSENSATGPVKVYMAGESFFEPAGSTHLEEDAAGMKFPSI